MRPRRLEDLVGQSHITDDGSPLRMMLANGRAPNLIVYGSPGTGKTTLATIITQMTGSFCFKLNAVSSNVAELRETLQKAKLRQQNGQQCILFIDEIHRFNKSQQDLLLPDVEEGVVTLIGATTHNPGFYVIPPLISRSHLIRLEPLSLEAILEVLRRALTDVEHGLGAKQLTANDERLMDIAHISNGDLRHALNILEVLSEMVAEGQEISVELIEGFAKERKIRYDANEDEHYDTISAYIKSMRGSDPDAALYWLAKMLEGGEDPRYVARRLVIFASEDVGMADSRALPLATATYEACDFVGLPECQINLAHATVFMACSPKSNHAYMGLNNAKALIRKEGVQQVPVWLRDKHGAANKQQGNSKDYQYSHDYQAGISGQDYMLEPHQFYFPGENGAEAAVAERLEKWKNIKKRVKSEKG